MDKFTLGRRTLLAGVSAALATAGCGSQPHAEGRIKKSSFLLVHGAWHGSWCYRRVADLLREQGHKVTTVTLSGLAERSNTRSLAIGLRTHVQDVINVANWEDLDDFVLVGHSYGGMVITGATEELERRIKSIVYLDAFIPASGKSMFDVLGEASRTRIESQAKQSGGFIPPVPAKVFAVEEANQAWVDSKCTPQSLATFSEPLPRAEAFERIPKKLYVRATRFPSPSFDGFAASLKDKPGWVVKEIDVGHDMMVDRPALTAELLVAAA